VPVKSIIDIELQTAAFERYAQLFDKYSETLRKQPEIWKKIQGQHEKLAQGFASLGNSTEKHLDAVRDLQELGDDQEKHLHLSGKLWDGIAVSSGKTVKNVASISTSLLKWTGLLSGISALTGYFSIAGLDRLGGDVAGWRKSSMGLGITSGQQRAFDLSFGRLLGSPEGFLGGINSAVSNLSAQGPLYALGVNPNDSTSQVAISTLQALRAKAQGTPTNQLGMLEQMYQLGNLGISVEDLRRLQSMKPGEFNQLLGTYRTQQSALGLGDDTQKRWTDFLTNMDLAKAKIENVFVKGLVPLTGPIERLATGFEHILEVSMRKDGGIAHAIDSVAAWLDAFSGKIAKPEFLTKVEQFTSDVGALSDAVHVIAFPFKGYKDISDLWTSGDQGGPLDSWSNLWNAIKGASTPPFMKYTQMASKMDAAYGLPAGTLEAFGNVASGMNPSARDSKSGAIGMMQLMPNVAASLGIDPHDPDDSLRGAAVLLRQYMIRYHGDRRKMAAASDPDYGEARLDQDIAKYGARWEDHLPAETQRYVLRTIQAALAGAIKVDLTNQTGGSVVASMSGLGATP
jgi:hypothetical protein